MSSTTLRRLSTHAGRAGAAFGLLAIVGGFCLGHPLAVAAGCSVFCLAAYLRVFGHLGSF